MFILISQCILPWSSHLEKELDL